MQTSSGIDAGVLRWCQPARAVRHARLHLHIACGQPSDNFHAYSMLLAAGWSMSTADRLCGLAVACTGISAPACSAM